MDPNAKKPLILIFSSVYLPMIGGAELAVKEITDRLSAQYEFVLFTARYRRAFPSHERMGAVDVRRLGIGLPIDKYLLPFLAYWNARRYIAAPSSQLPAPSFLVWGMMASYGSIAAYFFKRKNRTSPFLLTLQEGDPENYLLHGRWGLMGIWLRKIVGVADRVQVISFYLKRLAVKAGADFNRVDVVPNGVDLAVFGREWPTETRRDIYDRWGIPENRKIVITASRLVPKNGVDILIRAMVEIAGEHLIVAGSGPLEAELKALARTLKLESRVHFAGDLSHEELARHYAASHVFARPSRSEGLGSAFLEAMAAGLPVIATNVGGIPDFLTHNKTGVFVAVDDAQGLAYQIKHFFYDAEFRAKVSETARKMIYDEYSWDSVSKRMNGIFYRMMVS